MNPITGTYEKVTDAWNRIHTDHPEIHYVTSPTSISRMKYRDFMKSIAGTCRLAPDARILEAGCGSGRDTLYFSYLGFKSTAVDNNDAPLAKLEMAKRQLENHMKGTPLELEIVRADIFDLPFEGGTFDLVFNSGVIEHYEPTTRVRLLTELARIVKPGGYVAIAFPNKKHMLEPLWNKLIRRWSDFEEYEIPEHDVESEISGELHQAGLERTVLDWIDCYDTLCHFPNWFPHRIAAFAGTVILPRPKPELRRRLGTRVLAIAKKKSR